MVQKTINFITKNKQNTHLSSTTTTPITFSNDNMITSNNFNAYQIAQTEQQFLDAMSAYEASEENRTIFIS